MSIFTGALAPRFVGATISNPRFVSGALGGRYVVLAFLPEEPAAWHAAIGAMSAHQYLYDDRRLAMFGVLRRQADIDRARDRPGMRWFKD